MKTKKGRYYYKKKKMYDTPTIFGDLINKMDSIVVTTQDGDKVIVMNKDSYKLNKGYTITFDYTVDQAKQLLNKAVDECEWR